MSIYNPHQQNKKQTTDLSTFVFGKVQPQSLSIEKAVLGAIIFDKDAFHLVSNILRTDSFYLEIHKSIYDAACLLAKDGSPIDLLTVNEKLKKLETLDFIGGAYYLVELTSGVGSAANIEFHARVLVQHEMKRAAILEASRLLNEAYDDSSDVFDVMQNHSRAMSKINEIPERIEEKQTLQDISQRVRAKFEKRLRGETVGIHSFSTGINTVINGWQENKFIIIAARPSMGKTGFCMNEVYAAAVQGIQVNLFSLEMTDEEVFTILASIHCGIFLDKFNGKMGVTPEEVQKWFKAHEYICTLNISIKALSNQSVSSMKSHCRIKHRENGLAQICFIDYIQLMGSDEKQNKGQNREQDVSQLSRGLKLLAGEMKCPVIAFAQLSRAVETRGGDKVPQLSDLRESGSLEQDADIVSFLYRPEYYEIKEDENGESTANLMRCIIKKHRGGMLGDVKLKYIRQTQKLTDWGVFESEENDTFIAPVYVEENRVGSEHRIDPESDDLPF